MVDREHPRMPYVVAVEFRSASSFLITYSLNLSRGGLFVESAHDLPLGTAIDVAFRIPGAGDVALAGVVAWRREAGSPDGPPGLGVEFTDISAQLGQVIDQLVAQFHGISILVLATDSKDRASLTRLVKSIAASAATLQASDAAVAETLVTEDLDLMVIDVDGDPEGAIATLRLAKALSSPVPAIALASTKRLRDHARAAGADEMVGNPPAFEELQLAVMRALTKPAAVR
ncbi:MAG: TIGR02266 family protein [Myxococcales bacterium]|nr:TIGR02266 family protein [Myxococcales bacterium]MBK7194543.1 TIGR02266 family protein [Myxococcales bacterium]MBP6843471.1 TIGR02266 family protein [Kofleriaceae bacterium]